MSLYDYWPQAPPRKLMTPADLEQFRHHIPPKGGRELTHLLLEGALRKAVADLVITECKHSNALAAKKQYKRKRMRREMIESMGNTKSPAFIHPMFEDSDFELDEGEPESGRTRLNYSVKLPGGPFVDNPHVDVNDDTLVSLLTHFAEYGSKKGVFKPTVENAAEFSAHMETLLKQHREEDIEVAKSNDMESLSSHLENKYGLVLGRDEELGQRTTYKFSRSGGSYNYPLWRNGERILDHSALIAMGLLAECLAEEAMADS